MSSIIVIRKSLLRLLPIAALGMMAACASAPKTLGDHALEQGEKWNRGAEMVQDGQDLIKKGNKQVEKGNDQIASGNQNITEGKRMVAEGQALITEAETSIKSYQYGQAPQ